VALLLGSSAGFSSCGCTCPDYAKMLDKYRRFPCAANPTSLCDARGAPAEPLTAEEMAQRDDLIQKAADCESRGCSQ